MWSQAEQTERSEDFMYRHYNWCGEANHHSHQNIQKKGKHGKLYLDSKIFLQNLNTYNRLMLVHLIQYTLFYGLSITGLPGKC